MKLAVVSNDSSAILSRRDYLAVTVGTVSI